MEVLSAIDPILKLLEIFSILGAGGVAIWRMGVTSTEVKASINRQNEIIVEMKSEMKESMASINEAVTRLAVYDARIERLEEDLRELRHGRGFIQPLEINPSAPRSRGGG